MKMEANLAHALAALPHGPEFRFLDRLIELVPGQTGKAEYLVRRDASFLRGHFPGDPLMPGVLLIEAAAQLAGVVAQSDPAIAPLDDLRLTALQRVKIVGTVGPGARLEIAAEVTGRLAGLIQAHGTVSHAGTLLADMDLTLSGLVPGADSPAASPDVQSVDSTRS